MKEAQKSEKTALAIGQARELLQELYGVLKNPQVRRDPVVVALIKGLVDKDDAFKTAALTVGVLRNAQCLTGDAKTESNSATDGKKKTEKPKTGKEPSKKGKSEDKVQPAKFRSLTRSIDYLLDVSYVDDAGMAAIKTLQEKLRKNKDEEIDFLKDNKPVTRKVSEIGDWDLLYLKDETAYNSLLANVGSLDLKDLAKSESGYYTEGTTPHSAFGYLNQDSGFDDFLSDLADYIESDTVEKIFLDNKKARVLKGEPLNYLVDQVRKNLAREAVLPESKDLLTFYETFIKVLKKQPWFKFGKSPSISKISSAQGAVETGKDQPSSSGVAK